MEQQTTKLIRVAAWVYVLIDMLCAGGLALAGYSWKDNQPYSIIFLVVYAMLKKLTERAEPIKTIQDAPAVISPVVEIPVVEVPKMEDGGIVFTSTTSLIPSAPVVS